MTTSKAPKNLRKLLDKQLDMVSNLPEQLPAQETIHKDKPLEPVTLEEAISETVGRTLGFYSFDPESSKLEVRKAAKVATISGRIRRIVAETVDKWKSVKPIEPNKAQRLHDTLVVRHVDTRELDEMLYYTGTPDAMIKSIREEMSARGTEAFTAPDEIRASQNVLPAPRQEHECLSSRLPPPSTVPRSEECKNTPVPVADWEAEIDEEARRNALSHSRTPNSEITVTMGRREVQPAYKRQARPRPSEDDMVPLHRATGPNDADALGPGAKNQPSEEPKEAQQKAGPLSKDASTS
jgi:hypothetical protein